MTNSRRVGGPCGGYGGMVKPFMPVAFEMINFLIELVVGVIFTPFRQPLSFVSCIFFYAISSRRLLRLIRSFRTASPSRFTQSVWFIGDQRLSFECALLKIPDIFPTFSPLVSFHSWKIPRENVAVCVILEDAVKQKTRRKRKTERSCKFNPLFLLDGSCSSNSIKTSSCFSMGFPRFRSRRKRIICRRREPQ